jgi:RNA polymerase sigma-70 factor, ECF subfamily
MLRCPACGRLPLPAAAMPFSPWVDMEATGESYVTNRDPDTLVTPESEDPATIAVTRDTLRLALVASLQYLPPRQRAVLILREVLAVPAAEVATMLDTTTGAVKSTLQRARARLDEVALARDTLNEPTEPRPRALLDQYIAGFENADIAALEQPLRTDAAIDLVGTRTWFSGRATCLGFLRHVIGSPGDWRMIPTIANGQPAAAAYQRHRDGNLHPFGLAVLTVTDTGIARIFVFGGGPDLIATFGLPAVHHGTDVLPTTHS